VAEAVSFFYLNLITNLASAALSAP
jgi:hypothetical protein